VSNRDTRISLESYSQ